MREIKFRLFRLDTKQMFYDGFIINDRGKVFFTEAVINDEISEQLKKVYDVDYPSVFDYGDYSFQFCQLMQFTGLKDKNGKEIYEGDILVLPDTKTESVDVGVGVPMPVAQAQVGCFGEVVFMHGCFGLMLERNELYGYEKDLQTFNYLLHDYGLENKDMEVIGNIYENPELMKE